MSSLVQVSLEFEYIFLFFVFCFGITFGSFLNVVIYRIPLIMRYEYFKEIFFYVTDNFQGGIVNQKKLTKIARELDEQYAHYNVVTSPSRCPQCNSRISFLNNIPVFSWLLLKGKCKNCSSCISCQYPIVEFLCGISITLLAYLYGPTVEFLAFSFLVMGLICIFFIDLHEKLIPDDITIPFIWCGLLVNSLLAEGELSLYIYGAVIGYGVIYGINRFGEVLLGKQIIGIGDGKLLALIGAWCGVYSLFPIFYISLLFGTIVSVFLIVFRQKGRSECIAFGPFMSTAAFVYIALEGDISHFLL